MGGFVPFDCRLEMSNQRHKPTYTQGAETRSCPPKLPDIAYEYDGEADFSTPMRSVPQ